LPQHPPEPTTQNTDTGKPPAQWQRLTDDWGGLRPGLEDHGITPWFSVEPDLQYVHHTGGVSAHHDALALTIQATIDF
jgi:hypothetical protein